jgi:hypothetical protein
VRERTFGVTGVVAFFVILAWAVPAAAQFKFKQVPFERPKESGQTLQPAYEGWWQNADGTYNLMFGYFNRNSKEVLDVPVGQNNRMDPGPADQGQPAHFLPRRQKGVFTVTVPKDFGEKKLTWTLTANGHTLSVAGHLGAGWIIDPFSEPGIGNSPPTISFDQKGPSIQGPKPLVIERTVKAGVPLSLNIFAADDNKSLNIKVFRVVLAVIANAQRARAGLPPEPVTEASEAEIEKAVPDAEMMEEAKAAGLDADTIAVFMRANGVTLSWQKYRGPGDVAFDKPELKLEEAADSEVPVKNVFNGKGATIVNFSVPGDYVLRVVANDSSGREGGDFMCCWTNAEVKVSVK